ncbi:hypothetical protein C9374_005208 [Naegleria lovaniensis]|uniref:Uncharacterized protein n=1 Tax=Naegleria lovaniensis TaxID=51637 RepID=A0AA88GQD7_NAELO|nr:uncharacterized protein C9374_005208 [Naegleria lovaniensis]KAG2382628.1 hypothetical protein C9374_005208 [Naegleria lovaniensis]
MQKSKEKLDYYKILGVDRDCSEEDIKQSYRKLAKQFHPDLNVNKQQATEKFQEITEAYEVLSDPDKRQNYDAFGEAGLNNSNNSFEQMDSVMNPFDMYLNQFGFFETLFGGKVKPPTNEDQEMIIPIDVTLEELYTGCKRDFTKKRKIICRTCNGTGAFSNEHVFYCKACKGTGRRIMRRTLPRNIVQQFSTICMDCEGRGQYVTKKCETCKGRKLVNEIKTVTVNVEPGSRHGERIILRNHGDEWQNKATSDITFEIRQLPHKEFERVGDDLYVKKTITLLEALTGFQLTLNSLEKGKQIIVKCEDEVIQPGQKKAIPNQGMPKKGTTNEFGHLVVVFDVVFPEHLNMEMKRYLRILLDPKTKDLSSIPIPHDLRSVSSFSSSYSDGNISAFEINQTKGNEKRENENKHLIHAQFLPGHYGIKAGSLAPHNNLESSTAPPSTDSDRDGSIFSFIKNKIKSMFM